MPFLKMFSKYTAFHDKINKFCSPLSRIFGINHFFHFTMTADDFKKACGANPDYKVKYGAHGSNALLEAAEYGDASLVRAILEQDSSIVNYGNNSGQTALYLAGNYPTGKNLTEEQTDQISLEITQVLVEFGADVNLATKDFGKCTPLYGRVTHGHLRTALFLLKHGAFLNPPLKNKEVKLKLKHVINELKLETKKKK